MMSTTWQANTEVSSGSCFLRVAGKMNANFKKKEGKGSLKGGGGRS